MKKINFDKVKKKNLEKENKIKQIRSKIKKKKDTSEIDTEKPKRKKKIRFWYYLVIIIVIFALLCFIGGIGFCYYIVNSAPEFNAEKMFEKEATRIFDSQGTLIATLGSEQRQKVDYEELPQVLIDAIIATEDSRFFQHNGFDAPRFIKASISQVLHRGGGGASTLTMQLSKLAFTSTEDQGIKGIIRKFTDIYMAVFKMEKNFTKEEIIEYYVNTPCMGGNIYGVQQASQYYFGKDVKDLNLVEAAQIAGMFQSPNGYNPYINPNDANSRKNTVLYLMKRHGYITEEEYNAASKVKVSSLLKGGTVNASEYQGFIDTVAQEILDLTGNNPYDVPMDIYTTMVKSKQDAINNFYKTHKFRDAKIEVGVGVIDVNTGAIVAVGAGRDKTKAWTINLATFANQTKRMPGSTIKPILDYGPAIEYANLSTYGPFIDEKTTYAGSYMRNFNGSYKGFMTMRDCLKNSINTCALQAFRLTTNEEKYNFATSLGIKFDDEYIPESSAVGAFNGVSPVQLAGAYSAFANGGYYTEPYSFTKIVYRELDEEYKPKRERTKVMKETTAYMITSILTGATSSSVRVSGTQIATKTGTTSYDTDFLKRYGLTSSTIPDAWTSSYTKDYAMAIWYGYVDGLNAENVKNKYYLPNGHASSERIKIQAKLASGIYEKNAKFTNPGGFVTSEVELETIPPQLPSENTPSNLRGTFMFVSGTEPSETSQRFTTLVDPSNVTYRTSLDKIEVSWDSVATPSAIDTNYLTNYFNTNYGEWASNYLQKRINYNNSNIGEFGYQVYLTQGSNSTYVGWTSNNSYTIDRHKYIGVYDGVIVKSAYSKFANNASPGVKILLTNSNPIDNILDKFDKNDINVTMSSLNVSLPLNGTFKELTVNNVETIKLNSKDIKSSITNLSVITTNSINKNTKEKVAPNQITSNKGSYEVTYSVSFIYKGESITRSFTQNVVVN